MAHRLGESTIQQLEKALRERFGDPLSTVIREAPLVGPLTCDRCGFMAESAGNVTCDNCGTMPLTMVEDDAAQPLYYEIVDTQTKKVVDKAQDKASARRKVDNRDNKYGGYRFQARPVYAKSS